MSLYLALVRANLKCCVQVLVLHCKKDTEVHYSMSIRFYDKQRLRALLL